MEFVALCSVSYCTGAVGVSVILYPFIFPHLSLILYIFSIYPSFIPHSSDITYNFSFIPCSIYFSPFISCPLFFKHCQNFFLSCLYPLHITFISHNLLYLSIIYVSRTKCINIYASLSPPENDFHLKL